MSLVVFSCLRHLVIYMVVCANKIYDNIKKRVVSFSLDSENGKCLFLSVFLIHIIFSCLKTTMFIFPNVLFTLEKWIALCLVIIKIAVFDKYNLKQLVFSATLLTVTALVAVFSKYQEPLIFSIFLLGCKEVEFNKIIKVYFMATIMVLIAAFVASRLDIIEDLVYIRDYVVERNSFGVVYPTDFAAHIFFLLCAYYYLIKDSIQKKHLLAGFFVSALVYAYCDTRLDSITMILLVVGIGLLRFNNNFNGNNGRFLRLKQLSGTLIPYIPVIGFLFMYFMSYWFQPSITFFRLFDKLLSGRLRLGNKALEDYGLTLFGQQVVMNGNGGSLMHFGGNYFFIDCSYLLVYLRYGILFLLFIFLIHYLCCKKFKSDLYYIVFLTVIVVNCVVAHHMIELAYNPFYFALFAAKNGLKLPT